MVKRALVSLFILAGSFGPATADLLDECQGHAWPDAQMRACNELIMGQSFGLETKALAYQYRGEMRNNAGAFHHAIADFNESIRLKPDNAPAFAGRARARFSLKDFGGALGDFSEAIRLSPKNANLYIERGHVYLSQGNLDASIRDLTEAIGLDPGNASAFNNRGLALRKKGDFDGAVRDYDAAIAINPIYALAYLNRGYLKADRKQRAAAVSDLQKAILLDPSLVGARDVLKQLGGLPAVTGEIEHRIREGHELAKKKCSSCHAIGSQGRSPNAKAPEFRNLSHRHTLLSLRAPIARGLVAQHEKMPQFQLSDYQVDTIVAYINSLSITK